MARAFTPKVLTANHLLEGDVIYWADGVWVRALKEAEFFDDELTAQAALAKAQAQPDIVVGAYLADAALEDGHPVPTHFREDFRTKGPSNYAHGKQESQ
ncbi:MAG: DUF2849 domain-containing protein [Pseudomonadota bacterium]